MLVDTGSSISFIDPKHINPDSIYLDNDEMITTAIGQFNANKKVDLPLFAEFNEIPTTFQFCVRPFHKYFDGIIGLDLMEYLEAQPLICKPHKRFITRFASLPILEKPCLQSGKIPIEPSSRKICLLPVDTDNGHVLIRETKLNDNLLVSEGLYTAKNWICPVEVINTSNQAQIVHIEQPLRCESMFENYHECNFHMVNDEPSVSSLSIRDLIQTDHLNSQEKSAIFKICDEYQEIFFREGQNLSFTSATKHRIITNDELPIYTKSYRYPYIHKEEVQSQIQKLLQQGIIRPSYSPWSSPIWIVPKKLDSSGKQKWRMVIDYRKLNDKTVDDRYPLPNITEILDKLGRCMYFTSLDLASGFHQIEVDPRDIEKTAFSVENGHYEYVRMPFGLKNAPSTFQRVMDNVLRDLIGKECLVYIDDIVVFSVSLEEHIEKLTKVFQRLREWNLKIQVDKCHFLKKEIEFLGHVVSQDGIKPNPAKIEAIKSFPIPKTTKEIKGFLGLLGYYRKFIQDFAKITKPLTKKLRKGEDIDLDPEYVQAFEKCKTLLINDPILQYPDFSKPFNLTTDASNYAIGAVLSQGPIGHDKPVCYASRTLNKSEQNYSTTEKELLAIVWACKYFRPYLYGRKFNLLSDHQPLKSIHSMKNTNNKLTRWKLQLEEFEYTPMYIKGKNNVVADALSRIPEMHVNESSNATVHSAGSDNEDLIRISEQPLNSFTEQIIFLKQQNNSKLPARVYKVLFQTKHRQTFFYNEYTPQILTDIIKQYLGPKKLYAIYCPSDLVFQTFETVYDRYFSRNKSFKVIRCPKLLQDVESLEEQGELIKTTHETSNHRGINENTAELQREYYFPNMKSKISAFINNCDTCQLLKYDRDPPKQIFKITSTAKHPMDILHLDLFFIDHHIVLTIIDKFSRFSNAFVLPSKNSIEVIKALKRYFATHGLPKSIVYDSGREFVNALFNDFCRNAKIEVHQTSVGQHSSNSPIERLHSTLIEHYRILQSKDPNLEIQDAIDEVMLKYNNSIHSETKYKPFELFTGRTESFLDRYEAVKQHDYLEAIFNYQNELNRLVSDREQTRKEIRTNKLNENRKEPENYDPNQIVYIKETQRRTKSQPPFKKGKIETDLGPNVIIAKNKKIHKGKLKKKRLFQDTHPNGGLPPAKTRHNGPNPIPGTSTNNPGTSQAK